MKLTITGGEAFTLTSQTIDKLLRAGDGDAALLYLYMLRTNGQSTDEQAAISLGKSKGWVASATALLSRTGLIEIDAGTPDAATEQSDAARTAAARTAGQRSSIPRSANTQADDSAQDDGPLREPREYSREQILEEMKSGTGFSVVADETARRLGKPLTADDLLRLFGIYDNLRLPPEVILLLITHCISECRLRGDGRAPSMRYIEKAAYTWEREGLFTIDQAEEYLKAIEAQRSARGRIKQILQVRNREFSATEKRFVDGWIKMGFTPEVIELAYDKTIIGTGSLAYPYMDTILKKWDAKGIHTLQQAQNESSSRKTGGSGYNTGAGRGAGADRHGGPSVEEIERMKKLREKIET